MSDRRALADLRSVGRATLEDFRRLGIHSLEALAASDPRDLYDRLCALEGRRVDICQYDLFRCAVAQARDPGLARHAPERCDWFWWSRQRKAAEQCPPPERP